MEERKEAQESSCSMGVVGASFSDASSKKGIPAAAVFSFP